jgi:hypothetical protein
MFAAERETRASRYRPQNLQGNCIFVGIITAFYLFIYSIGVARYFVLRCCTKCEPALGKTFRGRQSEPE